MPDGLYEMLFQIHETPEGGAPLWTESKPAVRVADGFFTVYLGTTTPFPAPLFAEHPDLYVAVAVDLDTDGLDAQDAQLPRTPITAVPISLHAANASRLGGESTAAYATQEALGLFQTGVAAQQTAQDAQLAARAVAAEFALAAGEKVDFAAFAATQSAQNTAIAAKAAASELFQWEEATSGPVQAVKNHGYIVNAATELAITLPPSGALAVGDLVRLNAIGSGGWRLAQNDAQQVMTRGLRSSNYNGPWTPRAWLANWFDVASSADGLKLVVCGTLEQLHTSSDGGIAWTAHESARNWRSTACSANGTKMFACDGGGQVYCSTDSGETWTPKGPSANWNAIASSADGTKLIAGLSPGQIHLSIDSGETWTARESNRFWNGVASSADGTKLAACSSGTGGRIYTSPDAGETWIPRESERQWYALACSADGSHLVAGALTSQLYVSADFGETWTPRAVLNNWYHAAMSADGGVIAAVSLGMNQVYVSSDFGVTWTACAQSADNWRSVASSADGSRLIAVSTVDFLYTYNTASTPSRDHTTIGTTGGISGGQGAAVELQYIGNDRFMPLRHTGRLSTF